MRLPSLLLSENGTIGITTFHIDISAIHSVERGHLALYYVKIWSELRWTNDYHGLQELKRCASDQGQPFNEFSGMKNL